MRGPHGESQVSAQWSAHDLPLGARANLAARAVTALFRALPDAAACADLFVRVAATYKSGKIPRKTYIRSIHSFDEYAHPDEPTKRQLNYIRDLGGDGSKISTKSEASKYIDFLKEDSTVDPTRNRNGQLDISVGKIIKENSGSDTTRNKHGEFEISYGKFIAIVLAALILWAIFV